MTDTDERWQRRLERERQARKQAERLLEDKSRELFEANQALQSLTQSLERQVASRTVALNQALQATESANRRLQANQRVQERQIFAIDQHNIASATDRTGQIIYANDRFLEISGYTRAELMGANHRLLNSGVHPREMFEDLWRTIASGKVWKGEVCNRHKSGHLYWVNATIVPFLDEGGRPYQYFSIRTDITPLKQAQRELQQTVSDLGERVKEWTCLNAVTQALQEDEQTDEAVLQRVANLIPPGWLDPEHTCARVRCGSHECTSSGFQEAPWRQVAEVQQSGHAVLIEVFRQRQVRDAEAFLPEEQRLLDSIAMQIGQAMARRQAQRDLHLARDAAQAASLAKGEFLANMSHEIRTPMNGIIGMSQLALEAPGEPERVEHIQVVKQSAESLLEILNDILDFSKIEAGKMAIEQLRFNLREAVQLGLHALQLRAREKGLTLRWDVAPGVPTHVVGDPTRLRQVLVNLVGNGIKFTDHGEVRLTIRLAEAGEPAGLCFSVTDTGIGIPQAKLAHIFEAFSQADTSTTRQYGGTGLGLTITQRLVTLMGGTLQVASREGQGTRFDVALPLVLVPDTETAMQVPAPGAPAPPAAVVQPSGAAPLRVLLVEDHPVNQKLATHLLQRWGNVVTLACNGQEALDAIAEQARFDVVLMDMQMPVMDGLEATRRIRALEAERGGAVLPIIAMTANAMSGDRDECLAAGMNDYLSKPMRQAELSDKLAQWAPSPSTP